MVSCWLLLDAVIFPIKDVITFLNNFGYQVPNVYCVVNMTAYTLIIGRANWTEVCLGINRVIAICFPRQYSRFSSRKVVLCMLAATWVITLVVAPPATYNLGGHLAVIFLNQCVYVAFHRLGDFFVACVMFIPMVLIGICCTIILGKSFQIAHHQRSIANHVSVAGQENAVRKLLRRTTHKRRMGIAVMLFTSFFWGAACDLPYVVVLEGFQCLFSQYPILTVWVHFILDAQYTISPRVLKRGPKVGRLARGDRGSRGFDHEPEHTKTRSSVVSVSHVAEPSHAPESSRIVHHHRVSIY
ncbi:hypothetical protein BV898_03253 [Hypsibius exemplaris]|uniref:G-protein coupled receptors family 1 profile domain-containing protein n=1 Tax=Hypsibius exemplaris TaxID=2072580 RepID=A0A1W0X5P8_HYPEX|nr:hypothetical protein BV898_03253 [Hypsibius exemplaris]